MLVIKLPRKKKKEAVLWNEKRAAQESEFVKEFFLKIEKK